MDLWSDVVTQYRGFAADAGDSPCFEEWSIGVTSDPQVQEWIGSLPQPKQQPNLVFAAARWCGVPAPAPYAVLRAALLADDGPIRDTVLSRATQTNEVGRLATLVPALALAAGPERAPLALLEVGASAGLCLYPDRWSYRWQTGAGDVVTGAGPELVCRVEGPAPLPTAALTVDWRGGVDLHPLDVTDEDAMAWLTALVWPEQEDRRARLATAIEIARPDPPDLVAGDLLDHLPDLIAAASAHGRVVVFHSAVVAYLDEGQRRRFEELMADLVAGGACHWVSNEGKNVLPGVTATGPPVPQDHPTFILGLDGRAVAWTHGHGRSMRWLG